MIDIDAPDPFSLAAWKANRLPTEDPAKLTWLLCSLLNVVYGRPFLEFVEDAKMRPMNRA